MWRLLSLPPRFFVVRRLVRRCGRLDRLRASASRRFHGRDVDAHINGSGAAPRARAGRGRTNDMEPPPVEPPPAPAAAAAADPEVFEAILPEDLELPPDVDPDAPPAAEEPPAAPTPESVTPPADSSPAPAPVATTPMPPGLRKERDKAKRYRDAWESEKARADALATRPEAPIFVPLPADRRAALRKKAEEGSMGDVFDAITDGFTEMLRGGHQQREQQTREQAEQQVLEEQRQRVKEMED